MSQQPPKSLTAEKKQFRQAGPPVESGKANDQRIINHLPSTVTTRRSQSPIRRAQAVSAGSSNSLDAVQPNFVDNKFFHASEASQAMQTTSLTQRKPAFFTANSFSSNTKANVTTPELRRAESAMEVRSKSQARTFTTRTPTLRDTSPTRNHKSTATRPKLASIMRSEVGQDSPSPYTSAHLLSSQSGYFDTPSRVPPAPAESVRRQKSSISLRGGEPTRTIAQATETNMVLKSPSKERGDRTSRVSDRSVEALLPVSPQSLVSSSSSVPKSDYFENAMSQPAQTNRKMMDLEIRTTSLMAVNNHLERQSRRQATEMKDLRKKMAQLLKHPGTASVLTSEILLHDDSDGDMDEVNGEDNLHEVGLRLRHAADLVDMSIKRTLLLSEQLLRDATKGLSYKPRESEIGVGVRRVVVDSTSDVTGSMVEEQGDVEEDEDYGLRSDLLVEDEDVSGLDLAVSSSSLSSEAHTHNLLNDDRRGQI